MKSNSVLETDCVDVRILGDCYLLEASEHRLSCSGRTRGRTSDGRTSTCPRRTGMVACPHFLTRQPLRTLMGVGMRTIPVLVCNRLMM